MAGPKGSQILLLVMAGEAHSNAAVVTESRIFLLGLFLGHVAHLLGFCGGQKKTSSMVCHAEGLAHRWNPTTRPSGFSASVVDLVSGSYSPSFSKILLSPRLCQDDLQPDDPLRTVIRAVQWDWQNVDPSGPVPPGLAGIRPIPTRPRETRRKF